MNLLKMSQNRQKKYHVFYIQSKCQLYGMSLIISDSFYTQGTRTVLTCSVCTIYIEILKSVKRTPQLLTALFGGMAQMDVNSAPLFSDLPSQ